MIMFLLRYERRFSELYDQIQVLIIFVLEFLSNVIFQMMISEQIILYTQEKHRQTRKHYDTYNALLEIKELMLKEISLLNSIDSQVCVKPDSF